MTTGRGNEPSVPDGGLARHIPVLLDPMIEALAPTPSGLYLDGTFGAGGYTKAILATPDTRVLALDRDPDAVQRGAALVSKAGGRLMLERSRFSEMGEAATSLGLSGFDGIVLDIGVSSMQIDEAERGFSFMRDGPLDMRMSQAGRSAADIVNETDAEDLANLIYQLGEERQSRRIARAIVADRVLAPFTRTKQLADMIARVAPAKPNQIHPATRTFQALRIAVNDELGELTKALGAAQALLRPGGRLVVVSFHSLEDGTVKRFFAQASGRGEAASRLLPGEPKRAPATFTLPPGQPIMASEAEISSNPRARSARLRLGIRTDAAVSSDRRG